MFKRIKSVRKSKKDKKVKTIENGTIRRSRSSLELNTVGQVPRISQPRVPVKTFNHRRTKSVEQWSQTDCEEIDEVFDETENCQAQNCSNIEINQKNEIDHNMISRSELHPVYISSLLILVGFNFAAFSSFFISSNVPVYHMMLATTAGICVALFLRKFIGLNLFKTRDKVSERAVLTIVTQIRLVYKFLLSDYYYEMDEFVWSFFLFNLSIWILFLDKISFDFSSNIENVSNKIRTRLNRLIPS